MSAVFPLHQDDSTDASATERFARHLATQRNLLETVVKPPAEAEATSVVEPAVAASAQAPEQHVALDDAEEGIQSYLAEGEVVEGSLHMKRGVRIAGKVTGRVSCEQGTILVERTGVVEGGIDGHEKIIVDGTVGSEDRIDSVDFAQPSIHTPGLLTVMGSGRVYGCYQYGRLATFDDATLEGMGKKLRG